MAVFLNTSIRRATWVVALIGVFGVRDVVAQGSSSERFQAAMNAGYAAKASGDTATARASFEQALAADTSQYSPRVELAYLALAGGERERAVQLLQQAVLRNHTRADIRRQLGYTLTDLHRSAEAIVAFESIGTTSTGFSDQDRLALAYLYDAVARNAEAMDAYRLASRSTDTSVANPARRALRLKSDIGTAWFSEGYVAPMYQSRFESGIGFGFVRVGIEGGAEWAPAAYVSFRGNKDTKSTLGLQSRIISDNAAILAGGVRVRPFGGPVWLYAEAGTAYSLLSGANPKSERDVRIGSYIIAQDERRLFPSAKWKLMTDVAGDVSWYDRFDDNVIGNLQLREGIRFGTIGNRAIDLFGRGMVGYDSRGLFYNRTAEIGGGLAVRPVPGVAVFAEGIYGRYLERPPVPNSRHYHDWRITAVFGWRLLKPLHADEDVR